MSSSSTTNKEFTYTHSGEQLWRLLNSLVITVQRIKRPFSGSSMRSTVAPFYHEAILALNEHGEHLLIHKGQGFGINSQTIVQVLSKVEDSGEDTIVVELLENGQRSEWTVNSDVRHVTSAVRVTDLVAVGGRDYALLTKNCQQAVNDMFRICIN